MIITITGALGSGKSTIAKALSKKLGYKHYSTGDFMRQIADEHDMTLAQLNKVAETETWVDKELDQRQVELGKKENDFVIDGRLSWHFIPNSVKIYLDVTYEESARRIWADRGHRKGEGFTTFEDLLEKIKQRKESEIKRYKQYYNLNHHDKSNYDLVIDTTGNSPEDVLRKVMDHLKDSR